MRPLRLSRLTSYPDSCQCDRPHYPLRFFRKGRVILATRGTRPVQDRFADGWVETPVAPFAMYLLTEQYNQSHRFDWLHTPTYKDDLEAHLKGKEETAR